MGAIAEDGEFRGRGTCRETQDLGKWVLAGATEFERIAGDEIRD